MKSAPHPVEKVADQAVPFLRLGIVIAVHAVLDQLERVTAVQYRTDAVNQVDGVALESGIASRRLSVCGRTAHQIRRPNSGNGKQINSQLFTPRIPGHNPKRFLLDLLFQLLLTLGERNIRVDHIRRVRVPHARQTELRPGQFYDLQFGVAPLSVCIELVNWTGQRTGQQTLLQAVLKGAQKQRAALD